MAGLRNPAITLAVHAAFAGLVVRGIAGYGGWAIVVPFLGLLSLPWLAARRNLLGVAVMGSALLGVASGYGISRELPHVTWTAAALQTALTIWVWLALRDALPPS